MTDSVFMNDWEFDQFLEKKSSDQKEMNRHIASEQRAIKKDCHGMQTHLSDINGTIGDLRANQIVIQANQDILLTRIWRSLPSWVHRILIVWLAISIMAMPALGILIAISAIILAR